MREMATIVIVAASIACLAAVAEARPPVGHEAAIGGRHLQQYSNYGQPYPVTENNGAADDSVVGWSSNDADGYSAVTAPCTDSSLTRCHGRSECVDLTNNPLYCGSCAVNCDFYTQVCAAGQCVCKEGFSPCATYGNKCLDAESCPVGPAPGGPVAEAPQGSYVLPSGSG